MNRPGMRLTEEEQYMLSDAAPAATSMAMRILVSTARLMGAERLVPVTCAHIDGCLYYGDAGVAFAERLVELGGRVEVPSTLNVGSLDLLHPELVRADADYRDKSRRLMNAYLALGCVPSWTCAPYQAGYRPGLGEQIAWAESNAIVFANSVLGARTNRYGDYFDICAAITGRAPFTGLHRDENRLATVLADLGDIPGALLAQETFYPVLGAWLGRVAGAEIVAFQGIPEDVSEDRLKALAAAAASTGQVGLFHVIGVTPEAASMDAAFGGRQPARVLRPSLEEMREERDRLSTASGSNIDCIALGSPHFSFDECTRLARDCEGLVFRVPVYVCTRPDLLPKLEKTGARQAIEQAGGTFVVGTCVVVTPILQNASGTLMTNSAKFAHYGPSTVNHDVVYGSLQDCVRSAVSGRVEREEGAWS